MSVEIPFELIEKYIQGVCNKEEIEFIQDWYDSFDNDQDYISNLSKDEQDLLEEILSSVKEKEDFKIYPNHHKSRIFRWSAVAAAIAFLAISSVFLYNNPTVFRERILGSSKLAVNTDQIIKVENNSMKLMKAVLPDNSVVWLSPESKINYSHKFTKKERHLELSGECFFYVTKDVSHPFVIHSKHLITRVWGTSFRVKDLDKESLAEVSVVTGKVSVRTKPNSLKNEALTPSSDIMLKADEMVVYKEDKKLLEYSKIAYKEDSGLKMWVHANLNFENEDLSRVVNVLNEKFNVNINIEDQTLKQYKLNANFSDFNLPEILEAMSKSLNVNYTITNKTDIVLKPIIK
jgi:transmembrane sensor